MNKACMIGGFNGKNTYTLPMSEPEYIPAAKQLVLKALTGPISVFDMNSIAFSGPNDTYSLCNVSSSGWYIEKDTFDP